MSETISIQPPDGYNQRLVENVHPPDWRNPTPSGRYNMVVIGAGTAGLVTAAGAAGLGGKVALIEENLMGGDCLNVGCVPSKALLRSARQAALMRKGAAYGLAGDVDVDFAAVMQRVRRIRSEISTHDSVRRFSEMGVDVFLGRGRFTGSRTVTVGDQMLSFARACIATGARAVVPDVPGLAKVGCYTNETIFTLTECPGRLAVLGGGPIGCELAQAFARLGAGVTLIHRRDELLVRDDPEAGAMVRRAMLADGVDIRLATTVASVVADGGVRRLSLMSPEGASEIEADAILAGAGRAPAVEGLGLESAGVAYDLRKGVHVD
ncbi:MAG: FAD-dependent oxidoreductase, partial [Planctomycetota bacterium]